MADAKSAIPSSKKRVAGRQLTKDNPELDDDSPEGETGQFKRASDEVLATRRFVKVRRPQPASASSNPFAAIRFVPPPDSSAKASLSVQPDILGHKTVLEEKDNYKEKHEEPGQITGSESKSLVNELNGVEEVNTEVEEKTNVSTDVDVDKMKNDTAEEVTKLVEAGEEVETGVNETDRETREEEEETDREAGEEKEETKEEANEEAKGEKEETVIGEYEKTVVDETEKDKLENDKKDAAKPAASLSLFQQLSSSQNAFTGLAGTGFGASSFSFGSVGKEGSTFGATTGSIFGLKSENASFPSFGIGMSNNGGSSLQPFGSSGPDSIKSGMSGIPSMPEVPVETGEENEKAVFTSDAILYEYLDGGWKERGKGELRVNTSISGDEKARLVMRARGNYRLILNASLYPDMTLTSMDKKGITFACVNSAGEGKNGLTTFALKFKDSNFTEEFRGAVTAHKGKKNTVLKTPENSPKASDG